MTADTQAFWDAFAAGEPLALLVMNLHMGWTAPTEWINL